MPKKCSDTFANSFQFLLSSLCQWRKTTSSLFFFQSHCNEHLNIFSIFQVNSLFYSIFFSFKITECASFCRFNLKTRDVHKTVRMNFHSGLLSLLLLLGACVESSVYMIYWPWEVSVCMWFEVFIKTKALHFIHTIYLAQLQNSRVAFFQIHGTQMRSVDWIYRAIDLGAFCNAKCSCTNIPE